MTNRSLAQTLALVFGVAFLGAGVLGFIPGITTDLGDIEFAGKDSPSELLGIFQVSILHTSFTCSSASPASRCRARLRTPRCTCSTRA